MDSGDCRKIKIYCIESVYSIESWVYQSYDGFDTPPPPPNANSLRKTATPSRFVSRVVDAQLNMLKSLGIGAKDLPLPPLPPTVIQASAMASDNGVGNAGSTSASGNCTTVVYAFPEEDHLVMGYLNEWINAYSFITSEYTNGRALLSAGKTLFLSIPTTLARVGYDRVVLPHEAEGWRKIFLLAAWASYGTCTERKTPWRGVCPVNIEQFNFGY